MSKIVMPKKDDLLALQRQMSGKTYRNVLADLNAFTGFSAEEICARSIKKRTFGFGAKGWFNEEFAYFNPKTPAEYDWFYRASQIYLFSNARRHYWGEIDVLQAEDQPVLDYGAGIGQNVLELNYRGLKDAWYFEVGSIQCEFFRFRMARHGFEPKMIEPYHKGKFDTAGWLAGAPPFRTIIIQDVLEHVHNYDKILSALVAKLLPGGQVIEHSPFALKDNEKVKNEHTTRMHLVDRVGLQKFMTSLGMKLVRSQVTNEAKKAEVHTWKKN